MATDATGFSPSPTLVGLPEVFERIGSVVYRIMSPITKMVSRDLSLNMYSF